MSNAAAVPLPNSPTSSEQTIRATIHDICAQTLHNIRALQQEIEVISGAPRDIHRLVPDLKSLDNNICDLSAITELQWLRFEPYAMQQTVSTFMGCLKTCRSIDRRVGQWTRATKAMISWRDKIELNSQSLKGQIIEREALFLCACGKQLRLTRKIAAL